MRIRSKRPSCSLSLSVCLSLSLSLSHHGIAVALLKQLFAPHHLRTPTKFLRKRSKNSLRRAAWQQRPRDERGRRTPSEKLQPDEPEFLFHHFATPLVLVLYSSPHKLYCHRNPTKKNRPWRIFARKKETRHTSIPSRINYQNLLRALTRPRGVEDPCARTAW